jgi:hypothetical protein
MAKQKTNTAAYDASSLRDFDEYEGVLNSITNQLGKQDEVYKRINLNLKDTKGLMGSIADKIEKATDLEDKHKKQIENAARVYKESKKTIAESLLQYKKRDISQQEYNELILKARNNYVEIVNQIDSGNKSAARTIKTFQKAGQELDAFADAAEKSKKTLEAIDSIVDQIGGSGVEGVRELGDVIKSAANGGKGLTTALSAVVGVLAAMAYNYGLIGDKIGTIAGYDAKILAAQGSINETNQMLSMGMDLPTYDEAGKKITGTFEAVNYTAKKAMLDFSTSVQQMGASFQAASKTALFGKKLGSVGYGGAQLQMAGISAENIAESMKAASDATGKMPTAKAAADMAIMAQRTGQSTESIAIINETFQRLDNVSAKTALNLQEGVRAMADKAGVNLGSAMAEIAEASKDALSYQIKGGSQLAKQVIAAKSLGVSFNEVAKAGQNMVLNYKDSIKSEMSLSAMLGKNVNLSEVRAKFMSGDTEGAMNALKAQGLNPKDMNMFQQQALQQALGGMDLNSIQKISENTGKSGGVLKESNTEVANRTFLSAKQSAEAGLAASQAMISAAAQLESIKLDTAEQVQAQIALANNVNKVATETNNVKQLEALKDAETGLTAAIYGLITALAVQGIGGFLSKPGSFKDKVKSLNPFKTGAPAMEAVESPILSTTKKAGLEVAEKVGTKGIAKVGVKALGKSLLKKIPVIGLLTGVGFGLQRMMKGDMAGAALELASGAAGTIPGIGTAASIAIDGALAAKDMGVFGSTAKPSVGGAKPTISKEQQAKSIQTGTKPTVDAVNTMGQKQVDAQKMVAEKAKVTLTETQYQNKLQQEMVTLIGITAQYLAQISENTKGDTPININGKVLNNTLLNQARRNYAVAR